MNERIVLVTGANGRIGQEIVRQLASDGTATVAYVRPGRASDVPRGLQLVSIRTGIYEQEDLTEVMKEHKITDVIHLPAHFARGGVRGRHHALSREVNRDLALTVQIAAERVGSVNSLIISSTVAVFGRQIGEINEESPQMSIGSYGASKREMEAAVSSNARRIIPQFIRPGLVLGANADKVTESFYHMLAEGKPLLVGRGRGLLPVVGIKDVARAFRTVMADNKSHRSYNLVADMVPQHEVIDLYKDVVKKWIKPVPPFLASGLGHVMDYVSDHYEREVPFTYEYAKQAQAQNMHIRSDNIRTLGFEFTPMHVLFDETRDYLQRYAELHL